MDVPRGGPLEDSADGTGTDGGNPPLSFVDPI